MGGLFGGGGSKKHTGTAKETPAPAPIAAPATDPNVVASDAKRRTAGTTSTIMTAGVPTLEKPATETLGGGGSYG